MTKRVVLAAVLAGLAMWVADAAMHVATPLGSAGVQSLTNEQAVLETMRGAIPQPGFYYFPGMQNMRNPSEAEQQDWQRRLEQGPHGILVYHPAGGEAMSPRQLGMELASDIGIALILSWVVAFAGPTVGSFWRRVGLVTMLGALPWMATDFSHFNWYGFPAEYTLAQLGMYLIAFFVAGLVIAGVFRRQ